MDWALVTSTWVDDTVDLIDALDWPVVVLIAIGFLASRQGRALFQPLVGRVRKLSGPGGFGVELSETAAVATRETVELTIADYKHPLDREFEVAAYRAGIDSRLRYAVQSVFPVGTEPPSFRATVHVRDALYRDALYQLVGYYGESGGAGRRFSIRYGILGRTWRRESSGAKDVSPDVNELVERWGMTLPQAEYAAQRGRKSFLCILLKRGERPVGVLYMDSSERGSFGDTHVRLFQAKEETRRLAVAVARVQDEIAGLGPGLRLLEHD